MTILDGYVHRDKPINIVTTKFGGAGALKLSSVRPIFNRFVNLKIKIYRQKIKAPIYLICKQTLVLIYSTHTKVPFIDIFKNLISETLGKYYKNTACYILLL